MIGLGLPPHRALAVDDGLTAEMAGDASDRQSGSVAPGELLRRDQWTMPGTVPPWLVGQVQGKPGVLGAGAGQV